MEEKRQRMRELVERLREASKAYYQEDREIMSNFEYDKLYDELAGAGNRNRHRTCLEARLRMSDMNLRRSFPKSATNDRCFLWIKPRM